MLADAFVKAYYRVGGFLEDIAKTFEPLVNWQVWVNKTASRIRVGVERANATMKNWYGMAKVRYLGLDRNNCHLQFVAMAMNMKRALVLMRAP